MQLCFPLTLFCLCSLSQVHFSRAQPVSEGSSAHTVKSRIYYYKALHVYCLITYDYRPLRETLVHHYQYRYTRCIDLCSSIYMYM